MTALTFLEQASPDSEAVDLTLQAARNVLGMEAAYFGTLSETTFTFARIAGRWPGLSPGQELPRGDSLCGRMLAGAAQVVEDAAKDPSYSSCPARLQLGITAYVAVPLQTGADGALATICGIHPEPFRPPESAIRLLRSLADGLGEQLSRAATPVVLRRRSGGWAVESAAERSFEPSLTAAMVLADLLAEDLAPGARPRRGPEEPDEAGQLRMVIAQLEHALAARVVIEQAIGALAERLGLSPREAFERLRRTSRTRGRRVHDVARDVVTSINRPGVALPPELGRPRPGRGPAPGPPPRPAPPPRQVPT